MVSPEEKKKGSEPHQHPVKFSWALVAVAGLCGAAFLLGNQLCENTLLKASAEVRGRSMLTCFRRPPSFPGRVWCSSWPLACRTFWTLRLDGSLLLHRLAIDCRSEAEGGSQF